MEFSVDHYYFCGQLCATKYCLLKLAAVMSGVNAMNYRIIPFLYLYIYILYLYISEDKHFILTFVSLFLENQAFCRA